MHMNKGQPMDLLGHDASELACKRLFLFDMDGTIYLGNRLLHGTLQLLDLIRRSGGHYMFITNNSSRSVDDYMAKVRQMGIEATEDNFFTSSQATALHLRRMYPGALVYCQGTASMLRELRKAGIRITDQVDCNAEVVLVGFDTELTSEKLERTCRMLGKSNAYLATNPDWVCPVSFGYVPDCGSICQMLEHATGRRPEFIGKPQPTMIHIARETIGCSADETVLLGDRLYTDIASGLNAGVSTVFVLSGEGTLDDLPGSAVQPQFVFPSVLEVYRLLETLLP